MLGRIRNFAILGVAGLMLSASSVGLAQKRFVSTADSNQVRKALVKTTYYGVFDNLEYKIEGDTVTLSGQVVKPTTKDEAAGRVKHVAGVAHVINNIEVLPLSPNDDRIRRAEYNAIFGSGGLQRYGMGTNPSVHIIVNNGHVTLEGVVSNSGDRNLINIRANQVPGVFSVTNNLRTSRERR